MEMDEPVSNLKPETLPPLLPFKILPAVKASNEFLYSLLFSSNDGQGRIWPTSLLTRIEKHAKGP